MPTRIWRPYTQAKIASAAVPLERASGSFLIEKNGRKIFDGISSWWLITHGHCHPAIAEAIAKQAARLDQVVFANYTHQPAEELAEELTRLTGFEKVFFSDNGSTAVEVALKMAYQACAQLGQPNKRKFLAFQEAYHGDTVGAMSVSAKSAFTKPYQPMTFEVLRAEQPRRSSAALEEWTADFERILRAQHEQIAAVIVEPLVQGAAGMIVWPTDALRRLASLCRELDVFLIFDEVMTGFGRTGHMFAMHAIDTRPDFLCLSKGLTGGSLPLSVTLTHDNVFDAFLSDEKTKMFFHGHSFTGNAISCAAALANLKIFEEENTLNRIRHIESQHREEIAQLQGIRNPRVCGTIAAFELGDEDRSYTTRDFELLATRAYEQGLFMRPLGNTIYLMPPFCATTEDLSDAWKIVSTISKDFRGD